MLADMEWVQMLERIKVFPLVVLGALVILGLILYFVSIRSREHPPTPAAGDAGPSEKGAQARLPSRVEAPPVARDPGEKILEGADGAFASGMYPTALMFYKDFELRYAGTDAYERNVLRVWERMHTSNASIEKAKQDAGLGAYLETRRKLSDEWRRLKPALSSPPTPESRSQLQAFEQSLPEKDGRRKQIDAWIASARDEK